MTTTPPPEGTTEPRCENHGEKANDGQAFCCGCGTCQATEHIHGCFADDGSCEYPEDHRPVSPVPAAEDCPECGDGPGCRCGIDWTAPVVPDSTGLRTRAAEEVRRRGANNVASIIDAVLAVVGQGVTAESRDEAIRAATREVAKQARSWPGDGLLHDVPPVEAADAAVRAALESLGIAVVRSGEQGGE